MISERTLKKWRRESLIANLDCSHIESSIVNVIDQLNKRIIHLTQELLDQHLIRK